MELRHCLYCIKYPFLLFCTMTRLHFSYVVQNLFDIIKMYEQK